MTRRNDPGDAAFPDGERLHDAFAAEIDRPGLEGPSYEAVLRSGTALVRRRRVTFGATFAVAGVAAVATAAIATGGGTSRAVNTADGSTSTTPWAATGTTLAASTSAPNAGRATPPTTTTPSGTTATPASHPSDTVLASGTTDGHDWQLVRQFTLEQPPPGMKTPPSGWVAHWCSSLNIITDGVWTNAGGGGGCLTQGHTQLVPPDPANPGFSSITILDQHHDHLGGIVAGSVSPETASVTAQCGSKQITTKPFQPAGDNVAYYTFTFPRGSDCLTGTLSFFSASGTRTAFLTDVALAGGK